MRYSYDPVNGGLTSLCEWTAGQCTTSYVEDATYTPEGALDAVELGNGLTTAYGYADAAYPSRVTSIVTGTVQDLSFTYDDVGNVRTVTDGLIDETVTYSYDALDRLVGATGYSTARRPSTSTTRSATSSGRRRGRST